MREIKYRLIEKGKIVGYERHILIDGTISIQHQKINESIWRFIYPDYKDWICHDRKEQFTGLKDKNGKEIYEGDIVRFDNSDIGGQEYIGDIVWCDDQAIGCLGWGLWVKNGGYLHTDFLGNIEVIGNIHENPELLK